MIILVTGRNEVVAKVMFLQLCDSVHGGGGVVCLSACWDTPSAKETPPAKETPLPRRPPQEGGTPQEGDPPRRRHPPKRRHPPQKEAPPRRSHPPGRTHPPRRRPPPPPQEADSDIRSMTGWYASYWNAFLLSMDSWWQLCNTHCLFT